MRIRAEAERQRTEILANAERDAAAGAGEAMPMRRRSIRKAYSKNPEFYAFYRSLQAYERSLGKDGDLLVVTPDGEFFKYLKDPQAARVKALTAARKSPRVLESSPTCCAALALFFVFEGIAPFLNPRGVKRAFAKLLDVERPRVAHRRPRQHAGGRGHSLSRSLKGCSRVDG